MAALTRYQRTSATTRQRIRRYVAKWRKWLDLDGWNITVYFDDELAVAAQAIITQQYEEAVLSFNVRRIATECWGTPASVEELVVHELVHCVSPRSSERAVVQLTRAFLRVHDIHHAARRERGVYGRPR